MWLALLLNRNFRGKRIVRASMLLPFIVPTVLSTFAWRWMFDPTFSVLNWLLYHGGFITTKLPFLSDGTYGMWCAIVVNTWRGMPFFAITLLAGLQTISPDLHEAASLDGANGWQRFWHVTWPLLKPVTLVVVVFSVIQTFSDFQLIYVLTGGGPANATHLLATYAYQIGVATGLLGEGAAISLFMLPCSSSWSGSSSATSAAWKAPAMPTAGGGRRAQPEASQRIRRATYAHRSEQWSSSAAGRGGCYFYIPLTVFIIGTLFPFYWMFDHLHPARRRALSLVAAATNTPFWTLAADARALPGPDGEDDVPLAVEHVLHRGGVDADLAVLRAAGRLCPRRGCKFPMAGTLGTSIFVTYLVPPTLLFIPLADIIRTFQLGDTPWALILTYPTFLIPFCTWLLMGYFKTIPKELEECARIDGATRFGAMVRIIFPIAVPGILSAGIFAFTLSWNEFIYALVFLSSPEKKTVPVGVVSELIRGDVYFWGQLMAGALLGSIPVAIVYSFFVEYYVTGLTGSVKG